MSSLASCRSRLNSCLTFWPFVSAGSVDHSTIYDPPLEEDYPSLENNKIPPPPPAKENTNTGNNIPLGVSEDGDMPNEILLSTLGREPNKDVGIAYAEGGVTGKPSPQNLTGRSWDDTTKHFLIWACTGLPTGMMFSIFCPRTKKPILGFPVSNLITHMPWSPSYPFPHNIMDWQIKALCVLWHLYNLPSHAPECHFLCLPDQLLVACPGPTLTVNTDWLLF